MSLREMEPVEVNVERPDKLSQSFLAHVDACARSAYLYLKFRDGPSSHAMERGTAIHEAIRRFIELLVEQGENSAPSEVAKSVLDEVVREHPELQLPSHELDVCRVALHHVAENLWIEPADVVAVEKMLELAVGDTIIRGRVDFAAINLKTHHATIWDFKSSFAPPTTEDDDFSGSWQAKFYALLLAEGIGEGDPVGLGRDLDTFKVAEVYVRNRDLPTREAIITRQQVLDFLNQDVVAAIARAELGFSEGRWQAVPGSHCNRCPARSECPLPPQFLPGLPDGDDIEDHAQRWFWLSEEARKENKICRQWAQDNARSIPLGKDLELAFSMTEPSEKIDKKNIPLVKGLIASHGDGVAESDVIEKTAPSPRFGKRKIK